MCIFLNKKKKRAIAKWWIEQNRARVGESFFEHENGTSVCMRERERMERVLVEPEGGGGHLPP